MLNKVQVIGYLGNDPETRYTKDGTAVTEISVATTEKWKNKDGEPQERTEWHRIVFWGKLAEIAGEYLRKGRLVYVEGSLQTEKWTDKEGNDRWTTKIKSDNMKMLGGGSDRDDRGGDRGGSKGGTSSQRREPPSAREAYGNQSGPKREAPPKQNDFGDDFADDDIPF